MELGGKTAVVTGAASGIGLALSSQLLEAGARVVMADVEAGALAQAAEGLRGCGDVLAVVTDVTDPAAVTTLAEQARAAQLLFLNAGVTASGAAWDSTPDDWQWMWQVNVIGVVHAVRAFVPEMIASGLPGHVCITGSLAGYVNQPGFAAYNASKHAVTALAETLAADLREIGSPIGVTVVAPWFVSTRLAQSARNRPSELGDAAPPSAYLTDVWQKLTPYRAMAQTADEVARDALAGVRAGTFAVFPFAPSRDAVRHRFETILAGDVAGLYLP